MNKRYIINIYNLLSLIDNYYELDSKDLKYFHYFSIQKNLCNI